MKKIFSRRWVKEGVGLFVEETGADGIVAKFYKNGKATKFWRSGWQRNRYSC